MLVVGIEEMVHTPVLHMIQKFLIGKQSVDCRDLYVTRICLRLDRFLLMVLKLPLQDLWIMLLIVY